MKEKNLSTLRSNTDILIYGLEEPIPFECKDNSPCFYSMTGETGYIDSEVLMSHI